MEDQTTSTTPDALKSTYGGYFCFCNMMGQDIKSGTAKYWNTDYGATTIDLENLADGDTSLSYEFATDSTSLDRWSFSATLKDGSFHVVAEKDCGFETEDAGGTVTLQAIIAAGDNSFFIAMPHSSSCSTTFK